MRKNIFMTALFVGALFMGTASAQTDSPLLDFVEGYFQSYNNADFQESCGMLSPWKCDPTSYSGVARFAEEFNKMRNGYEAVSVWIPEGVSEDQYYDIVCVKNSYGYKYSQEDATVTEIMSYYLQDRKDGTKEIVYRVCEEKTYSDGRTTDCPVLSAADYCLDASARSPREIISNLEVEEVETIDVESLESVQDVVEKEEVMDEAVNLENKEKTIYMLLEEIEKLKAEIERMGKELIGSLAEEEPATEEGEITEENLVSNETFETAKEEADASTEMTEEMSAEEVVEEALEKVSENMEKLEIKLGTAAEDEESGLKITLLEESVEDTEDGTESEDSETLTEVEVSAEEVSEDEAEFCDFKTLGEDACNGKTVQITGKLYPEDMITERILTDQYLQFLDTDTPIFEHERETDLGFTLFLSLDEMNCEGPLSVTGTLKLKECIAEDAEKCAGYCEKVVVVEAWECEAGEETEGEGEAETTIEIEPSTLMNLSL